MIKYSQFYRKLNSRTERPLFCLKLLDPTNKSVRWFCNRTDGMPIISRTASFLLEEATRRGEELQCYQIVEIVPEPHRPDIEEPIVKRIHKTVLAWEEN